MESIWMNHLGHFKDLLTKESVALDKLLHCEDEKYDALKQVDVQKLMQINSIEEDLLIHLHQVEKKRKDIILLLSKLFHFEPHLTLKEIFEIIPNGDLDTVKNELMVMRDQIKNLTGKLQTTMHENSQMIHSNLEIINLTLNYANKNSQKETYDYRSKKETRENNYLVNQIA